MKRNRYVNFSNILFNPICPSNCHVNIYNQYTIRYVIKMFYIIFFHMESSKSSVHCTLPAHQFDELQFKCPVTPRGWHTGQQKQPPGLHRRLLVRGLSLPRSPTDFGPIIKLYASFMLLNKSLSSLSMPHFHT